jgi:uncharacterized membrane protein YedE/YeeE
MPESFINALLGGACIGLAATLLMILLGRIAGVSGILFTALKSPLNNFWAIFFFSGLLLGAFGYHFISGNPVPTFDVSLPLIITGGFIVGLGTKMGSGCTSGHGICGIGRLSVRSIIATCTFMLFGFITVFVRLHGGLL